jgi:hypothetical protein
MPMSSLASLSVPSVTPQQPISASAHNASAAAAAALSMTAAASFLSETYDGCSGADINETYEDEAFVVFDDDNDDADLASTLQSSMSPRT